MTTYALVHSERGDTGKRRVFAEAPPELAAKKNLRWLPLRREPDPDFDPATQRLSAAVTTVGAEKVTVERQVVDLTVTEQLVAMRNRRAERYREELGKLPDNTREETIGDVLDAILKFIAANRAALEALGVVFPDEIVEIAVKVQQIKAEIPKPAEAAARNKV